MSVWTSLKEAKWRLPLRETEEASSSTPTYNRLLHTTFIPGTFIPPSYHLSVLRPTARYSSSPAIGEAGSLTAYRLHRLRLNADPDQPSSAEATGATPAPLQTPADPDPTANRSSGFPGPRGRPLSGR
ncbi:hypothetical protein CDD80_7467 [Ophiocordyceps camponoti-rufipedis]|uniref:Uncharacterized protein n=1 Tax=Ophiocordyceps camponoti-rufipedis TaxID=2004952 RepID=A0A2C5XRH6_9HYPO|nr:hypothetical protein CDD80_7467 [Ophiocordyceps camponoti-rufipedis]